MHDVHIKSYIQRNLIQDLYIRLIWLEVKLTLHFIVKLRKPKAAIHFYIIISCSTSKFYLKIPILLWSFPNSNSIFCPSMEYLTTKILYPYPNQRRLAVLASVYSGQYSEARAPRAVSNGAKRHISSYGGV